METFLYLDTNVLRNFGKAFQSAELEPSLRSRIVLSPLSVAEILAQAQCEDAYKDIQAIWNWLEPTNAQALDWPEVFIREQVFGITAPMTTTLPNVFKKLDECLHSSPTLESFRKTAEEITESWKEALRKSAEARRSNVECIRSHDVKDRKDLMRQFSLKTIRSLAAVEDSNAVADDEIMGKLNAYIELDIAIFSDALNNLTYNFDKHADVQVDIEELIYLADDRARYLSSDKNAYKRLSGTPQWARIRIEDPSPLMDAQQATEILKQMVEN